MTLVYTLSQSCNAKSDTRSDTHSPTCGIEVVHGIKGDDHICIVHPSVMADPVLLQGPHVGHGDLHMPHAGDGIQDHFVPPEVSL